MPALLHFQKKKLKPPHDIYAIKQVNGRHIENVKVGDVIEFKRTGTDNNWGFTIYFDPPNIPSIVVGAGGAGPSRIDWTVPNNHGTFKYDVSFPHDNTQGHVVEKLDPVIIINP
jgi:hypothetical protein